MNNIETNLKKNLLFDLKILVEDCEKMYQHYGRKSVVNYIRRFKTNMSKNYFNEYKYELSYVWDNLEIAKHILKEDNDK